MNMKKCRFAEKEVNFCGKLIGGGRRRANPEKLSVIREMQRPQTKTELFRILGFFSFCREHTPDFAGMAKPLIILTSKSCVNVKVSNKIPWDASHDVALQSLKRELCRATERSLHIVDFDKPYDFFVDDSDQAVGGVLTQTDQIGVKTL